jgi:hypothetical protein
VRSALAVDVHGEGAQVREATTTTIGNGGDPLPRRRDSASTASPGSGRPEACGSRVLPPHSPRPMTIGSSSRP